mmetsp:Transcript_56313/g.160356  ORF Transcript_56313/g.160356 Transcript_56313/m.160356 type:complete len:281 (-) Transcript_56313:163-1005(-)
MDPAQAIARPSVFADELHITRSVVQIEKEEQAQGVHDDFLGAEAAADYEVGVEDAPKDDPKIGECPEVEPPLAVEVNRWVDTIQISEYVVVFSPSVHLIQNRVQGIDAKQEDEANCERFCSCDAVPVACSGLVATSFPPIPRNMVFTSYSPSEPHAHENSRGRHPLEQHHRREAEEPHRGLETPLRALPEAPCVPPEGSDAVDVPGQGVALHQPVVPDDLLGNAAQLQPALRTRDPHLRVLLLVLLTPARRPARLLHPQQGGGWLPQLAVWRGRAVPGAA